MGLITWCNKKKTPSLKPQVPNSMEEVKREKWEKWRKGGGCQNFKVCQGNAGAESL